MEIESIVTEFVLEDVEGALFINGPWGIGKSFYWKHKLAPLLNTQEHSESRKKYKCLYVSLNGINDLNAIYYQLLQQKFPKGDSSIFRKIATPLARLTMRLPVVNAYVSDAFFVSAIGELLNFDTNIICFDDIERIGTQLKQEEVLGFINTHFVEQKKIKTIVIGWEKEIAIGQDDQRERYHRIKEKIFYRTIEFPPDLIGVREIIPKYIQNKPFHAFLLQHTEYLEGLLKKYRQPNLRTLIFCLDSLQVIFNSLINAKPSGEILVSILFFVMVIGFEYKTGQLTTSDARDYKNIDQVFLNYNAVITERIIRANRKAGDNRKNDPPPYDMIFFDRYGLDSVDEFYFFPSIYTYLLSGYLDHNSVLNELETYKKFQSTRPQENRPEKLAADVISRPFYVNDEEYFSQQFQQFLIFIDQGKYYFNEYGVYYDYLVRLANNGLTDLTEQEIRQRILDGCLVAFENHHFPDEYLDHLPERLNSKNEPVNNLINELYEKLLKKKENKKIADYIFALHGPEGNFDRKYLHFNPFAYLDAKEIYAELEKATIPSLRNFYHYLETQTSTDGSSHTYVPFASAIKALADDLKKQEFGENERLRKYQFKLIEEKLRQIV